MKDPGGQLFTGTSGSGSYLDILVATEKKYVVRKTLFPEILETFDK
jgi:hypothetical protein